MTLGSNNLFPSVLIVEGTAPAAPSAGDQRLYIDSTSHKLTRINSSSASTTIESNYTSALVWTSGTAMPGGPATNQRVTRTDLGLDYYYDGTRWVTTQQFGLTLIPDGAMPMTAPALRAPFPSGADIYVIEWRGYVYLQGTNNGTNYWTFQLKYDLNAGSSNLGGTTNTSAMAISNFIALSVTGINTAVAASAAAAFEMAITKTLSPTSMFVAAEMIYRLIGT